MDETDSLSSLNRVVIMQSADIIHHATLMTITTLLSTCRAKSVLLAPTNAVRAAPECRLVPATPFMARYSPDAQLAFTCEQQTPKTPTLQSASPCCNQPSRSRIHKPTIDHEKRLQHLYLKKERKGKKTWLEYVISFSMCDRDNRREDGALRGGIISHIM